MIRLPNLLLLSAATLLLTAHRLPAPISEVEATATPQPKASVGAARVVKEQLTPSASVGATEANNFAGTWMGTINMQDRGDVDVTLTISGDGRSVEQRSEVAISRYPVTYNDTSMSWQAGAQNRIAWTLTLNPDRQTALGKREFAGKTTTAIFKRVQSRPLKRAPAEKKTSSKRPVKVKQSPAY